MRNKHYISLWALLLVAFGIIAWASKYDKITFLGHDFKTASFVDELTSIPELEDQITRWVPPVTAVAPDSLLHKPKFPADLDTLPKTILFFGDSMLEGLSPRLADYCKENGHKLYTVIWYSSTTQVWGDCDTLSTFIRQYNPDYIFACLGANELFVKDIKKKRQTPLFHILNEIGDRPFLWIGPPNWKEDTGINELLEQTLPEGTFFLTNGMKFSRKRDGAHPTSASAAEWMDSIVRWMPRHCLHPIKLDMPSSKGRADRVILLQPLK